MAPTLNNDQGVFDMTTSVLDDAESVKATEPGTPPEGPHDVSLWTRNGWAWIAAGLVLVGGVMGAFGYSKYQTLHDQQTTAQRHKQSREAATQLAKDYALKSLTYSYQDPDGFFRSVEDGVSASLKDKYVNATTILKAIMMQAQVTSSGDIISAEATEQPGDVYQVVVTAGQTIRNLQNPEPRVSTLVLQITVDKNGDTWQITDIGPRVRNGPGNLHQSPSLPGSPVAQPPTRGSR
ncbi:hypothetical protein BKG68_21270 [Mycobacteroides saopaulense]|uniref:Mammalian cell entry protein n=2 Tax=Mycobacteroides saopaulense TaxID=1578165 RepID=A0ABX3BZ47_9MYCO|nr:hypothetical protein [Mycobacteroides saopaulense]OHT81486.1 hypothetical protein BKG68_21270 [Mycobacteroides saopaulense]OHU09014.1 hypothetical protein BKG73_13230 [Mycobacteroides saopaulense]